MLPSASQDRQRVGRQTVILKRMVTSPKCHGSSGSTNLVAQGLLRSPDPMGTVVWTKLRLEIRLGD